MSRADWERFAQECQFRAAGIAIKWIFLKAIGWRKKRKESRARCFEYGPDGMIRERPATINDLGFRRDYRHYARYEPECISSLWISAARRQKRDKKGRFVKQPKR